MSFIEEASAVEVPGIYNQTNMQFFFIGCQVALPNSFAGKDLGSQIMEKTLFSQILDDYKPTFLHLQTIYMGNLIARYLAK
jgi:hypothetical protein